MDGGITARSFLVTFLDIVLRRGAPTPAYTAGCVWSFRQGCRLELKFFVKALPVLKSICTEFGADLKHTREHAYLAVPEAPAAPLCARAVRTLQQRALATFGRGSLDYAATVFSLLSAVIAYLTDRCRDIFPSEKVDLYDIRSQPSHPFNEEWSAHIDMAFEGGGERGTLVLFPNANDFGERLLEAARIPIERVFLEFHHRCYRAVPHEIVHCLQFKMGQQDTSPMSWSAEHDASLVANGLLWAASQNDVFSACFPPGQYEEVMLQQLLAIQALSHVFTPEVDSAYREWRRSFGLTGPPPDMGQQAGLPYAFKMRLQAESAADTHSDVHAQLAAIFLNRCGDVTKLPTPAAPAGVKLTWERQLAAAPVDEVARLVAGLP